MTQENLPVAVIGAGPIGLAAAAHLIQQGETPLILEAGAAVGASILNWGHIRLFTPWRYATDKASTALLEGTGWQLPDPESHPTGAELVANYLQPLAEVSAMKNAIRLNSRVIRIARQGFDKMKTVGREKAPFVITVQNENGEEVDYLAKAVIDASGNYTTPNPLGANGTPALNERAFADNIAYGIPNVLGKDRARYENKTVLVAGSGASAFNVLLDLTRLTETAPQTKVIWVIRRALTKRMFGGGEADELPARGSLGQRVRELVEQGVFQVIPEFKTMKLRRVGSQIEVSSENVVAGPVDEIIVTTGFRPDLSILSELRLSLDPAVESPVALASMIDPNFHSCGSVSPHGAEELKQPEPDFYIVGSKSYGRAPTFLLLTGYEQVRSVAAAIAGDWESARQVQLELPQSGVCSSGQDESLTGAACCGTPSAVRGVKAGNLINLTEIAVPSSAGSCESPALVTEGMEQNVDVTVRASSGSCCG